MSKFNFNEKRTTSIQDFIAQFKPEIGYPITNLSVDNNRLFYRKAKRRIIIWL